MAWLEPRLESGQGVYIYRSNPTDKPEELMWSLYRTFLKERLKQRTALPFRAESIDRSLKTDSEREYWASRTPERKPAKTPKRKEEAAEERRWTGIARNLARLNDNQTKQFQILRRELDVAVGDGHSTHGVSVRILKTVEAMLWNQTQFQGEMMEVMLDVQEKVNRLTSA